jgi:hypothetical protein
VPEDTKERLSFQIQGMSVSEKVKLAMRTGSKEVRAMLIKDSNKQVVLCALDNPLITEPEIEAAARNRSIPDEALRKIAKNREWMKNYSVQIALVTNPKTPPGVAVRFVNNLRNIDLRHLERNKGVSEAVRIAAKRAIQIRKNI